jgi:hypothetical protein
LEDSLFIDNALVRTNTAVRPCAISRCYGAAGLDAGRRKRNILAEKVGPLEVGKVGIDMSISTLQTNDTI